MYRYSFLAEDGGYVQARTIELGGIVTFRVSMLLFPEDKNWVSYTPTGVNGLRFRAKYGMGRTGYHSERLCG